VGVFCSQPLLCTFSDLVTVVDVELTTLFAGLEEALVAPSLAILLCVGLCRLQEWVNERDLQLVGSTVWAVLWRNLVRYWVVPSSLSMAEYTVDQGRDGICGVQPLEGVRHVVGHLFLVLEDSVFCLGRLFW
jgi:hypothetical protein